MAIKQRYLIVFMNRYHLLIDLTVHGRIITVQLLHFGSACCIRVS